MKKIPYLIKVVLIGLLMGLAAICIFILFSGSSIPADYSYPSDYLYESVKLRCDMDDMYISCAPGGPSNCGCGVLVYINVWVVFPGILVMSLIPSSFYTSIWAEFAIIILGYTLLSIMVGYIIEFIKKHKKQ